MTNIQTSNTCLIQVVGVTVFIAGFFVFKGIEERRSATMRHDKALHGRVIWAEIKRYPTIAVVEGVDTVRFVYPSDTLWNYVRRNDSIAKERGEDSCTVIRGGERRRLPF